jgi:hypothetical protein
MMESKTAIWKRLFEAIAFSVVAIAPAFAQEPVVIVDIKAVVNEIGQHINTEASLLPLTVQAPLQVAAKVCGVPVSVLGAQGSSSGAVGCEATATSPELDKIVRGKIRKDAQAQ